MVLRTERLGLNTNELGSKPQQLCAKKKSAVGGHRNGFGIGKILRGDFVDQDREKLSGAAEKWSNNLVYIFIFSMKRVSAVHFVNLKPTLWVKWTSPFCSVNINSLSKTGAYERTYLSATPFIYGLCRYWLLMAGVLRCSRCQQIGTFIRSLKKPNFLTERNAGKATVLVRLNVKMVIRVNLWKYLSRRPNIGPCSELVLFGST